MILMGLGIFVLALTTLPERLQAPFGLTPQRNRTLADASFAPDSPEALLSQTKDTDRDGIPDAQELQVYKTSPFLEDSDSDGVLDKVEIDSSTDPNCPKGKDCRALAFPSARDIGQDELLKKLYESTATSKLEKTGIPGISDAVSIRGFLRSAGVTEDILKQFDDAALIKLFKETAAQQGVGTGGFAFESSEAKPPEGQSALPANPSPKDIRELLLKDGFDKAVLGKFTDAQIVKLYQETLQDVNKKE